MKNEKTKPRANNKNPSVGQRSIEGLGVAIASSKGEELLFVLPTCKSLTWTSPR